MMRIGAVLLSVAAIMNPAYAFNQSLTARPSQAAANPKSASPPITLHAKARLVVVDVVVTGKDNQPVNGLKETNFTLLEDGKPQKIVSFDEHTATTGAAAAKIPALPKLPPGVFTNYTPAPVSSAANIVLLDALNSSVSDQDYLLQQLTHYLTTLPRGTSIAVFGLNQRLVLLQSFSSDPAVLLAAAKKLNGHPSPLLSDTIGGEKTAEAHR